MALFTYPSVSIDTTGLATEAKQDALLTDTGTIVTNTGTTATNTGTTATNTGTTATNTGTTATNTGNTAASVASIDGKVSTEAKQDTVITQLTNLNSKMDGDMFAIDHDYRDLNYVAAGTGIGQVSDIVLKSGGSGGATVRTITFTYTTNALGDDVVDTIDWS